ncbi:MAG: response regulator [Myxococcota bacterium]
MASRLLVVDDNEDNRDMLARRLQRRGYEVDTAEDGFAALRMVDAHPYDLVLLDIMMPGMSGIEVLAKLRETYPRAELPILMATAKSDSKDMVEALSLGANDYVTKPIDFPVVLARIESHLQTRLQAPSIPAPAAVLPPDGRAEPGTILDGRYEVEEIIGEGGFAIVFRAMQLSTGQKVAVKVLRHRRASVGQEDVERKRFEREMKTIGKLKHPAVVRLIDFGTLKARVSEQHETWSETTDASGKMATVQETTSTRVILRSLPYIVMEYVQGETMSALLRREGPLTVERAVELLLPVLSAVSVAHEAGVLHRDLKPPNIMVTQSGGRLEPKVLDFGIAKPFGEENASFVSRAEGFLGTPEYMAPELIRDTSQAHPTADQYALGCLLYESVTGQRPFKQESFVELLQQISTGAYPRPADLGLQLPATFEALIERAMDANPERRFSSVLALGRAMLPFASAQVRARWEPFFDVATDPPPPPPEPSETPNVHDAPTREVDTLPTRELRRTEPAPEPSESLTPQTPVPPSSMSATRIGLILIGVGAVLAAAAAAALLLK